MTFSVRDQRVLTTVMHVEGDSGESIPFIYIPPGTSLRELAEILGVTLRFEYRREPWTENELRRGDLEATIADLRQEFPAGDYPAPTHSTDEPCTYCEALYFLDD